MKLICPECKNDVDLTLYTQVDKDHVVECNVCGITLLVTDVGENGQVLAQVVDEGK